MAYDDQCNWIYVIYDVTICRHFDVWRSLLTQRAYYCTRTLLSRYCSLQCVTVIHINLLALQVRRPEQNTALSAKTEQFITAKISGNSLKHGSRTYSVLRQSSSQLQKYNVVHSKSAGKHTQRHDGVVHK